MFKNSNRFIYSNDKSLAASIYSRIGFIYLKLGIPSLALDYLLESLNIINSNELTLNLKVNMIKL